MRISDWSSDVCSSDLIDRAAMAAAVGAAAPLPAQRDAGRQLNGVSVAHRGGQDRGIATITASPAHTLRQHTMRAIAQCSHRRAVHQADLDDTITGTAGILARPAVAAHGDLEIEGDRTTRHGQHRLHPGTGTGHTAVASDAPHALRPTPP